MLARAPGSARPAIFAHSSLHTHASTQIEHKYYTRIPGANVTTPQLIHTLQIIYDVMDVCYIAAQCALDV